MLHLCNKILLCNEKVELCLPANTRVKLKDMMKKFPVQHLQIV